MEPAAGSWMFIFLLKGLRFYVNWWEGKSFVFLLARSPAYCHWCTGVHQLFLKATLSPKQVEVSLPDDPKQPALCADCRSNSKYSNCIQQRPLKAVLTCPPRIGKDIYLRNYESGNDKCPPVWVVTLASALHSSILWLIHRDQPDHTSHRHGPNKEARSTLQQSHLTRTQSNRDDRPYQHEASYGG